MSQTGDSQCVLERDGIVTCSISYHIWVSCIDSKIHRRQDAEEYTQRHPGRRELKGRERMLCIDTEKSLGDFGKADD